MGSIAPQWEDPIEVTKPSVLLFVVNYYLELLLRQTGHLVHLLIVREIRGHAEDPAHLRIYDAPGHLGAIVFGMGTQGFG